MRVAYVEMVGGAAGDMLLAAFLDAGLERAALEDALRSIVAEGWTFAPQRVTKCGIAATYAGLVVAGEDGDTAHRHDAPHAAHAHRTLGDVLALLDGSALTTLQRERASAVYRRLAEAEARVHGVAAEAVRFHEVGQIDAVLDVAATCVALDLLEIDELRCSPFPVGHGTLSLHHGRYPNPAPATAELLRGWPTTSVDIAAELVTPTGAAILTALARPGPRRDMTPERVGYGAGRSDFPFPNVVRVTVGTTPFDARGGEREDEAAIVEANVDDMSPQHYELAVERLFAAGARDVWLTPIVMKKGRPAMTVSALAAPEHEGNVARAMLRETTTIGVRVRRERRLVLERTLEHVATPFGTVRVKAVRVDGVRRLRTEYEDLLRIARERELPLEEVARAVDAALREEPG